MLEISRKSFETFEKRTPGLYLPMPFCEGPYYIRSHGRCEIAIKESFARTITVVLENSRPTYVPIVGMAFWTTFPLSDGGSVTYGTIGFITIDESVFLLPHGMKFSKLNFADCRFLVSLFTLMQFNRGRL